MSARPRSSEDRATPGAGGSVAGSNPVGGSIVLHFDPYPGPDEYDQEGKCVVCSAEAYDPQLETDRGYRLCDTCWIAWTQGVTIEEARDDVEEGASYWHIHLGRGEGRKCTCGTVDHLAGSGFRVHLDVRHESGCPLAPPDFHWEAVDEDARELVFGYRGRTAHAARLIDVLKQILKDRELFGD
jgi:hypothetical protein